MAKPSDTHRYDDIIHLPHHISTAHPHMPVSDRAAQFSPFAALTGHQETLREAARLTSEKIELDENAKTILDHKLHLLLEKSPGMPTITITYFERDPKKDGGSYKRISGILKRIDPNRRMVILDGSIEIPVEDIIDVDKFQ